MTIKDPLTEGNQYEVRFTADNANIGTTAVTVGWVPQPGAKVPDPVTKMAAPSGLISISGQVPQASAAFFMQVIVKFGAKGSGELVVLEAKQPHTDDTISDQDTVHGFVTWTMSVVEAS